MRKLLLTSVLLSATVAMAEPPQTSFYLSGFNGETSATEANTLVYVEGDADDEEDGIYRFVNNEFVVADCAEGFVAVGAEGLRLGYNADNAFGFENMVNDRSTMMALCDGGPAVNCELSPGTYKVILASMQEDETEPMAWTIMFQKQGAEEETAYYLLGFNGDSEPSQGNCLVKEVSEEDGETVVIYTYPRFLVESCEDGFTVGTNSDVVLGLDPAFAENAPEVTDESPMAFLAEGGEAVACSLTPGYYSVRFAPMGTTSMIMFERCEDQTPADESTYYLLGFDGVTAAADDVKFTRTEDKYVDEETGEEEISYSYVIDKIHLTSCPDGFTVSTADGGFSFGVAKDFASMIGDTVTEDNPMGMLGIYGTPYGYELPEGDYTVTFICTGVTGMITFLPYEDAAVEGIEGEAATDKAPVYYNLQGVRVDNPSKGIFIRKSGSKVEKVAL